MTLLIFTIHLAFILIYAGLVAALLWHYGKYKLPNEKARWIIWTFIVLSALFAVVSTIILFMIPWEEIIQS